MTDNNKWEQELGEELATQDNLCTAHPIFNVYDYERVYTTSDYAEEYCFLDEDFDEVDLDFMRRVLLDEHDTNTVGMYKEDIIEEATEKGVVSKEYYVERKVWKNTFFTRKAAEQWMKSQAHHLTDKAHIYVDSLWRNPEMQRVREHFLSLRAEQ